MKKILTAAMVLCLLLAMTACGGGDTADDSVMRADTNNNTIDFSANGAGPESMSVAGYLTVKEGEKIEMSCDIASGGIVATIYSTDVDPEEDAEATGEEMMDQPDESLQVCVLTAYADEESEDTTTSTSGTTIEPGEYAVWFSVTEEGTTGTATVTTAK